MDKMEMIGEIARKRMVESTVKDMVRKPLDASMKDLCQTVYVYLMEMDEDTLQRLWDGGMMKRYIIRVSYIQLRWHRTQFDKEIRQFSRMTVPLDEGRYYPGMCEWPGLYAAEHAKGDAILDIIERRLTEEERDTLTRYTDCRSYRELGMYAGLSPMGAYKKVRRIKRKVMDLYELHDNI